MPKSNRSSAALDLACLKAVRALADIARRHVVRRSSPARCTPPRRLQSTTFDGRSPGLRVTAARAFPVIPVAEARARRLQLRGQLRIWDHSRHRIPFSPPQCGRTIAGDRIGWAAGGQRLPDVHGH